MKNRIETQTKVLTRDYSGKQLTRFWEERETNTPKKGKFSTLVFSENKRNLMLSLIQQAKTSLVLHCPELLDPGIVKELAQATARGVRVYLLLGKKSGEWKALAGKALIRLQPGIKGTLLITDRSQGGFLNASLQDGFEHLANVYLPLDEEQVAEMYYWFCHQFWIKVEKEILLEGNWKEPRKVKKSPFGGIPLVDSWLREEKIPHSLNVQLEETHEAKLGFLNIRSGISLEIGKKYRIS